MSDVQFSEEQSLMRSSPAVQESGGLLDLPIKLGVARTQKDAVVVLIGIVAVCIVVAGFSFLGSSKKSTVSPKQYEQTAQHAGLAPH
jgi:hypothetical protein